MVWRLVVVVVVTACGRSAPPPPTAAPEQPAVVAPPDAAPPDAAPPDAAAAESTLPWLKGSTHVHTLYSGDADTPVAEVIAWYQAAAYDFIVITDHNRVTTVPAAGSMLVLPGVELTYNPSRCDPPPLEPDGKCRIHVNALALETFTSTALGIRPQAIEWADRSSAMRADQYQAAIDRSRALGGLVQLNHPRWHWGVDGPLLAELGGRGVALVEIANAAFSSWNDGEPSRHPSSEAMWDAALSAGATVWAVASDDAHHYGAAPSSGPFYPPGGGFVMVRADRRPEAIRGALARGEFYASTGVYLERVGTRAGRYEVEVAATSPGEHHLEFIGTGGAVIAEADGRGMAIDLAAAPAGYLRAVITDASGHKAWTQPVRVGVALH